MFSGLLKTIKNPALILLGIMIGASLVWFTRPQIDIPACPQCPDAVLEVQPIQLDFTEAERNKIRGNFEITVAPVYNGNIIVSDSNAYREICENQ